MKNINYSRNTVGCTVGGNIFIHPELYKYPELYHSIITHEKKHSKTFKGRDIVIDVFNDDLKGQKKGFYRFILTHPRTLLGYLPVTKVGKHWGFDIELTVVWASAIALGWFVGSKI